MKIQGLAIIFIIIIMPIAIVLSQYVNNRITIATTELEYNTKLLNATYDSIKAYQLNTVNNAYGDVTNSKISDIEAAVTTFYNSLANNFNFTGYKADVMKEYIPAVAFTLYDGYYIYSPFKNTLTGVKEEDVDTTYSKPDATTNGLKPYIYYSSRYKYDTSDFIINYTLDNYITIMGIINGNYVYDSGFLYSIADTKEKSNEGNGIYYDSINKSYWFDGIEFKDTDTEELKEYVGDKEYRYTRINGQKYYLEEDSSNVEQDADGVNKKARFFFVNDKGEKNYNHVDAYSATNSNFKKYYFAIKKNKSAYIYYKKAYEFSSMVLGKWIDNYYDRAKTKQTSAYGLQNLKASNSIYYDSEEPKTKELKTSGITPLSEYGDFKIFDGNMHSANSNFYKHRKAIIRYVIETNMSPAISGFSSSANTEFIMPKISEKDWETIQNDVCEITFLQGLNIGSKKYNGYSVVANMLTKEYVDEDDIYILKNDNTYCKANDSTLDNSNIKINNEYYPGIWKINFERKKDISGETEIYYYPMSFWNGSNIESYLGSYTSIMGSSKINEIGTTTCPDMYSYMHNQNTTLKKTYYMALGRERWCSYNVNNINYEIYGNNANNYFLEDY